MLVFKYQTISPFFWKNFTNNSLWFRTPLNFDDDYDGQIPLNFNYSNKEMELLFRVSYLSNFKTQEGFEANFGRALQAFENDPSMKIKFLTDYFKQHSQDKIGISCFSTDEFNRRLWAEYSTKFTGVCFGFDTDKDTDFFSSCEPVRYVDEFPKMKLNLYDLPTSLKELYTTKHNSWQDQNEQRVFRHSEGEYQYKTESLKEITFGTRIDKKCLQKVLSIGIQQNPKTSFYRLVKHNGGYEKESI